MCFDGGVFLIMPVCVGLGGGSSYFNDLWQVGYQVKRSRLEIARLHLKLGDFRKCRLMCQQLMALPSTRQTQGSDGSNEERDDKDDLEHLAEVEALHQEAVERIKREGKVGLVTIAAIALVIGGLLVWQRQQGLEPKKEQSS